MTASLLSPIVSYIIGGFSLLVGILIMLSRKVDNELLAARETIKGEFLLAYNEFANNINGETIDTRKLENSTRRLKRLHYASHWDLLKLRIIEWLMSKSIILMLFVWISVACFLTIGHFAFDETQIVYKIIFLVALPLLLLGSQAIYLVWLVTIERYLKRIRIAYNNLEYPS